MIDILTTLLAARIRECSDFRGDGRRPPMAVGEV